MPFCLARCCWIHPQPGALEPCSFFSRDGNTQRAATDSQHEIDLLRRDRFRRTDKVAFVLTVFIVDNNNHATLLKGIDRLLDRLQRHGFQFCIKWRNGISVADFWQPLASILGNIGFQTTRSCVPRTPAMRIAAHPTNSADQNLVFMESFFWGSGRFARSASEEFNY